jgi:hypothetical protein
MPATYEPIASATVSGTSTNSVTFSSIPAGFTDVVLIAAYSLTGAALPQFQVNSDTATNYSDTDLTGNGTTASSGRDSSKGNGYLGNNGQNNNVVVAQFMSYANTNINKTVLSSYANAGTAVDRRVNLWRSTAAITSIKFYLSANNFADGAIVSLFGIRAA